MKYIIIAMLCLTICAIVYARLGETPDECNRRYGTPSDYPEPELEKAIVEKRVYLRNGIRVEVHFQREEDSIIRANFIQYSKPGDLWNVRLSSNELHTFLGANAQGSKWEERGSLEEALEEPDSYRRTEEIVAALRDSYWIRTDYEAVAYYYGPDNLLMIGTLKSTDRYEQGKVDPLSGF